MTLRQSKHKRTMTPAQEEANRRSFRTFRLRGVYYQCLSLTGWRLRIAQLCVDAELLLIGAQTETHRSNLIRDALDERAQIDREAELWEIPF